MTVRLAPPPVLLPDAAVVRDPGLRPTPLPGKQPAARVEQPPAVTSALPLAPDPHYYPARDLDSYPWPLAPLPLDRPAGERVGTVRLEMMIDETGIVRDVVFVQPARPGQAEEGLRAALAATHFMPARKDGRAVRSRVTLRLDFTPADGGQ
jgi:protein TonB